MKSPSLVALVSVVCSLFLNSVLAQDQTEAKQVYKEGDTLTVNVNSSTEIKVNDESADATALVAGMQVKVLNLDDSDKTLAVGIEAYKVQDVATSKDEAKKKKKAAADLPKKPLTWYIKSVSGSAITLAREQVHTKVNDSADAAN